MSRVNLMLLLALMASALYLVRVQYDSRRLYAELDRTLNEAQRLEVEQDGLQVEQRALATPARVEKLAKAQLRMQGASPGVTHYVTLREPVAPAARPTP